jgi:hypothetical protein
LELSCLQLSQGTPKISRAQPEAWSQTRNSFSYNCEKEQSLLALPHQTFDLQDYEIMNFSDTTQFLVLRYSRPSKLIYNKIS